MSTIDPAEIERFSRISEEWWNPTGKFRPLHRMNPVRITYIREQALAHFSLPDAPSPLQGLRLLDIGCGGGLIAEPMARLGAHVTGIDASEKNIGVARVHAEKTGLAIDYRHTAAEDLAEAGEQFDIVLALEIVEHVADTDAFIRACLQCLRPGGLLILSTLNRTAKSYALAIVGAEYVLRWLPIGTHQWKKFLRPSELLALVERHGGQLKQLTGMVMHPLTQVWALSDKDLSVNYLLSAVKR